MEPTRLLKIVGHWCYRNYVGSLLTIYLQLVEQIHLFVRFLCGDVYVNPGPAKYPLNQEDLYIVISQRNRESY